MTDLEPVPSVAGTFPFAIAQTIGRWRQTLPMTLTWNEMMAAAVLDMPEMQAIKAVLKSYARPSLTRRDLENKGLPDSVIEWVVS